MIPLFHSLRFKFFGVIFVLTITLLASLYAFNYQTNLNTLETEFQRELRQSTYTLENQFETMIETPLLSSLIFLAQSPNISLYFDAPQVEQRLHRNEVEQLLIRAIQINPVLLKSISVFDGQGIERIKVTDKRRVRQGKLNLLNPPSATSRPFQTIFQVLQSAPPPQERISPVINLNDQSTRYVIGISLSDSMFDSFAGMLAIEFSIEAFLEILTQFEFRSIPAYCAIDRQFQVFRQPPPHPWLLPPHEIVPRSLQDNQPFLTTPEGYYAVIPITFDHQSQSPLFYLSTGISRQIFDAEVQQIQQRFVLIGLLAIGVILALTFYFTRLFLNPITRLANVARKIAATDDPSELDIVIGMQSRDEIGQLAHAFDEMLSELKALFLTQQEKIRLATIIEHLEDMIEVTDPEGIFIYINPAHEKTMGYSLMDLYGKTPAIFQNPHHSDAFYQAMRDTISAGKVWRGELVGKRKDGSLCYQEAVISPVHNEKGTIVNYSSPEKFFPMA